MYKGMKAYNTLDILGLWTNGYNTIFFLLFLSQDENILFGS